MLIKRLTLKNILSFKETTIELEQLNVLIGPNAVGKSNLIETIGLLQAAPTGIEGQILRGGGEMCIRDRNKSGGRQPLARHLKRERVVHDLSLIHIC